MEDLNHQNSNYHHNSLFRKEVLQSNQVSYLGKTLIVTPISFSIWSFGIFLVAITIGLFLYFGEYSKKQIVPGVLIPDKGLINIYAKSHGIVINKFVQQGQEVAKGQLLYLISAEQEALSQQGVSAQQLSLLEKQIAIQKQKISALEKNTNNYKALLNKHFISIPEYQKHEDEYLTAKLTLYNYEKELRQIKEDIHYAIKAPIDGTISMLVAMVGDHVTGDTLIASIIPKDSTLEARLLVPTSKAGFIKVGQKVLLKYHAYPYQRYGLYEGVINSIDRSVINPQDLNTLHIPIAMEEAFYRVTAKLRTQAVTIYGKPYPLTAGMLFDAVIIGEKRKIWQWIIDTSFNVKGSFST